jgi:hypothetical protein
VRVLVVSEQIMNLARVALGEAPRLAEQRDGVASVKRAKIVRPFTFIELGSMDEIARDDEHRAVGPGRRRFEDVGDSLEVCDISLKVGGDDQSAAIREVDDALHVVSIADARWVRLAGTSREH